MNDVEFARTAPDCRAPAIVAALLRHALDSNPCAQARDVLAHLHAAPHSLSGMRESNLAADHLKPT